MNLYRSIPSGRSACPCLAALVILAAPVPVPADIATEYGISPRAIAMGGAYTALADDFSGYYHNPAGTAMRSGDFLTLGYLYNTPRIKVRSNGGPGEIALRETLRGGVAGFSLDVGQFVPERYRPVMTMGLTVVFPDDFKTYVSADIPWFDDRQFPVIGRAQDFSLMYIGMGIRPHRMISIGGSVRVGFTSDIRSLSLSFDVTDPTNPKVTYQKVDVNPDLEMQPIAGIILSPWESLRIGAAWRRGGSPVTFLGAVEVLLKVGPVEVALPPYAMFVKDFYNPEEFALSVAYAFHRRLLVAVELTYARWSGYNLPYGEKPPGHPLRDVLVPRVGAEIDLPHDIKVRLGYYHQPTPVRGVQPYTQLLDTDQHVFSTGLGYSWRWVAQYIGFPPEFDFYFQYKHHPRRTLQTVVYRYDPEGNLHVVPGETTVWGHQYNLGASVQLRF